MKKMKIIPSAVVGAAVTLTLLWLGATGHFGGEPLGAFRRSLYLLLLPAELIGEAAGSFTSFLIAGFLEFFVIYVLGLLLWEWARSRKQV